MASLMLDEVIRACTMARSLGYDQNLLLSPGCALFSPRSHFRHFTYLPTQSFGTPCTHSISTMEVIKNLFMLRWYGSPQELEKAPTMRVPRKPAKKMRF